MRVEKDLCISCGLCVRTCEEAFDFDDDGLAFVKDGANTNTESAKEALENCPTNAIKEN